MLARLRCCYYLIACMTIIIASHALVPSQDLKSLVAQKNQRTIGSLFTTDVGAEKRNRIKRPRRTLKNRNRFFLDPITTTVSSKNFARGASYDDEKKSLMRMPSPEIFRDSDSLFDSDSNAPHVRVKRIDDSIVTPVRSSGNSPLFYTDRRGGSQRKYKRYATERMNPADENEAEYTNFEEGNIDITGNAFLDDEVFKRRNHLEDVYPEVLDLPKTKDSRAKRSNVANKRRLDQLHRSQNVEDEYENVDCVNDDGVDDEVELCEDSQDQQSDGQSNNYDEIEEDKEQTMNKHTSGSKASESSRLDRENAELSRNVQNSKLTEEEEELAALKGKSRKSYKKNRTKPKSKKEPRDNDAKGKRNPVRGRAKVRVKSSKKKPRPKLSDKKKYTKSIMESKNSANRISANKKVDVESIGNDCDDKYAEEDEDKLAKKVADNERLKRNKNILVKAIPSGDSLRELQIFQKADHSKKRLNNVYAKSSAIQKAQFETTPIKSESYIGEMKDLLSKLIVKIDDLHNLVAEMSRAGDGQPVITEEKITRPDYPVGNQRLRPCGSRKSVSTPMVRWSPWTRWSSCSVNCGRGSQTRDRRCIGGCNHRLSTESQTRICRLSDCPPSKFLGIF